ncbi:MAG: hypothetical protein ABW318_10390 [Vicinamibacterales bacterium]
MFEKLLKDAVASPYGIVVSVDDVRAARYLRRRLYSDRCQARKSGATELDEISILIKPAPDPRQCEVWLVRRPALPTKPQLQTHRSRLLRSEELPAKILARGPGSVTLLFNSLYSAVGAGAPSDR